MQTQTNPVRPTQAVILAGGRGERMRPWTDLRPKPMIEIAGKPFLEHLIELLRSQGFERVLLLLGYLPEQVQDYFGDGGRWGVRIEYSVTDADDLTGQRLRSAETGLDDCFFLLYCDNYWPLRMDRMWERFLVAKAPAMLTVYGNKDGYTKDTLKVDEAGFVTHYDKQRVTPGLKGTEISYAILRKELLQRLPAGNVSFEESLFPVLAQERQLAAYVTDHRYYSIGGIARLPLTEIFLARRPAIILDRDGVLNEKSPSAEYVRTWDQFKWRPDAKESLRRLHAAGFRVIIVSNQGGVARGALTEAGLKDLHLRMVREAGQSGGRVDAIYYCPHDPDAGCECCKPRPGLLFQAQRDFSLDLSRTMFVGDDERDAQAADAAGCASALVSESKSLLQIVTEVMATFKRG